MDLHMEVLLESVKIMDLLFALYRVSMDTYLVDIQVFHGVKMVNTNKIIKHLYFHLLKKQSTLSNKIKLQMLFTIMRATKILVVLQHLAILISHQMEYNKGQKRERII
jgi:hypothetical protein